MISIAFVTLGTVTKGLVQEMRDLEKRRRVETVLTTAFLDRPEYYEVS